MEKNLEFSFLFLSVFNIYYLSADNYENKYKRQHLFLRFTSSKPMDSRPSFSFCCSLLYFSFHFKDGYNRGKKYRIHKCGNTCENQKLGSSTSPVLSSSLNKGRHWWAVSERGLGMKVLQLQNVQVSKLPKNSSSAWLISSLVKPLTKLRLKR